MRPNDHAKRDRRIHFERSRLWSLTTQSEVRCRDTDQRMAPATLPSDERIFGLLIKDTSLGGEAFPLDGTDKLLAVPGEIVIRAGREELGRALLRYDDHQGNVAAEKIES